MLMYCGPENLMLKEGDLLLDYVKINLMAVFLFGLVMCNVYALAF
jgi:hypothetical protein